MTKADTQCAYQPFSFTDAYQKECQLSIEEGANSRKAIKTAIKLFGDAYLYRGSFFIECDTCSELGALHWEAGLEVAYIA